MEDASCPGLRKRPKESTRPTPKGIPESESWSVVVWGPLCEGGTLNLGNEMRKKKKKKSEHQQSQRHTDTPLSSSNRQLHAHPSWSTDGPSDWKCQTGIVASGASTLRQRAKCTTTKLTFSSIISVSRKGRRALEAAKEKGVS
jgi:hypothetical protein